MDLSWNFAAESQAYDRVHRLGQEKDVFVKRLVVENTIEERMLRLQDVKKGAWILILSHSICFDVVYVFLGLADAALGEGTGVKLNKLSVREIKAVRVPFSAISLFLSARVLFLALRNDTPSETAGERRWRWWRLLIHRLLSMPNRWRGLMINKLPLYLCSC